MGQQNEWDNEGRVVTSKYFWSTTVPGMKVNCTRVDVTRQPCQVINLGEGKLRRKKNGQVWVDSLVRENT